MNERTNEAVRQSTTVFDNAVLCCAVPRCSLCCVLQCCCVVLRSNQQTHLSAVPKRHSLSLLTEMYRVTVDE